MSTESQLFDDLVHDLFHGPCRDRIASLKAENARLKAERDELRDKAIAYDLDQAGIQQRDAEAVELVDLRARVRELEAEVCTHLRRAEKLRTALQGRAIFI